MSFSCCRERWSAAKPRHIIPATNACVGRRASMPRGQDPAIADGPTLCPRRFHRVGPEPEFASWAAIWRSGFPEALESRARNSRRRL